LRKDFFLQSPSENHSEDDEPMNFATNSAKDGISEDITEETANSGK